MWVPLGDEPNATKPPPKVSQYQKKGARNDAGRTSAPTPTNAAPAERKPKPTHISRIQQFRNQAAQNKKQEKGFQLIEKNTAGDSTGEGGRGGDPSYHSQVCS